MCRVNTMEHYSTYKTDSAIRCMPLEDITLSENREAQKDFLGSLSKTGHVKPMSPPTIL